MAITDPVKIPVLSGKTQSEAAQALTDAGLAVGTIAKSASDTIAADTVIGSTPAAGETAERGSKVNLQMSTGRAAQPDKVPVPSVIGLTRHAADAMLRSAGLQPGDEWKTEVSTAIPSGGVSSQEPVPGALADRGQKVVLKLSSGVKSGLAAWMTRAGFAVLTVALLIIIIWVLRGGQGSVLESLAKDENARGLITFLIAITTVGIAVILALSTIVLEDSEENEKRFDRGKQILTILIGVLGTIVGFYFGSARNEASAPASPPALAISSTSLPAGAANTAYQTTLEATGGTPPLKWSVTPALPDGFTLKEETGELSGTAKVAVRSDLTFTVSDSAKPAQSATQKLTLEIK